MNIANAVSTDDEYYCTSDYSCTKKVLLCGTVENASKVVSCSRGKSMATI